MVCLVRAIGLCTLENFTLLSGASWVEVVVFVSYEMNKTQVMVEPTTQCVYNSLSNNIVLDLDMNF